MSTFNEYDMTDDDQSTSIAVSHMSPVGGSTPVTRIHVGSEDDRDSAISSKSADNDSK